MKSAIALLLVVLYCPTGCAPRAIVIDPIAPTAAKAAVVVANAGKSAAISQNHAASVTVEARSIAVEVMAATAEVDRLRKAESVKPQEFEALWNMVTGLQTRTAEHAQTAGAAEHAATETRIAADTAAQAMQDLNRDAVRHDAAVVDLKTQAASQAADAANGRLLKWCLGIAFMLGLVFLAVKFLPPLRLY